MCLCVCTRECLYMCVQANVCVHVDVCEYGYVCVHTCAPMAGSSKKGVDSRIESDYFSAGMPWLLGRGEMPWLGKPGNMTGRSMKVEARDSSAGTLSLLLIFPQRTSSKTACLGNSVRSLFSFLGRDTLLQLVAVGGGLPASREGVLVSFSHA